MQEEQVNLDIKQKMLEYAEGLESFAQDAGNFAQEEIPLVIQEYLCLLYTSPSPRDRQKSRMPSSA